MLQIHPNAHTTPATRAEIARSSEPSGNARRQRVLDGKTPSQIAAAHLKADP